MSMLSKITIFTDTIRTTKKVLGAPHDVLNYSETYKLPFKFDEINGMMVNGVFVVDEVSANAETGEVTLSEMPTFDTDDIYIMYGEEIATYDTFDIVNLYEYNFSNNPISNTTVITFFGQSYSRLPDLKEIFGLFINGLYYGTKDVIYDTVTRQFTVSNLLLIPGDSVAIACTYQVK